MEIDIERTYCCSCSCWKKILIPLMGCMILVTAYCYFSNLQLSEQVNTNKENIEKLQKDVQDINKNVDKLQKDVIKNTEDVDKLQKDVKSLEKRVKKLEECR